MWPFKKSVRKDAELTSARNQALRQDLERRTRRLIMRTTLDGARAYLQEKHRDSAVQEHVWSPIPNPGQDVLCFAISDQIQIETLSGELLVTCYLNLKANGRVEDDPLPDEADSYEDEETEILIALDEL